MNSGAIPEEMHLYLPSVVEVETALPAFVGYTGKAFRKSIDDLLLVPVKINSMREFENFFGFPFVNDIEVTVFTDDTNGNVCTSISEASLSYLLYYSLKLYFDNGGEACYVVAVGTYRNPQQIVLKGSLGSNYFGLQDGLNKLAETPDVSLIVIPEAVKLIENEYAVLVQAALLQCHTLGNRFAIFDLYNGDNAIADLNLNRGLFGSNYLNCGSAYYPYLKTTLNYYINSEGSNVSVNYLAKVVHLGQLKKMNYSLFKFVRNELKSRFVNLPASGAVAGAYVTSDKYRGVWKSPANICLNAVIEPVCCVDHHPFELGTADQEDFKSINCIRASMGKGPLVHGARTLEVKEDEGRYVSVRRFMIMVRASLKKSTCWVVLEPNEPHTWINVTRMIEKYLTLKWQAGALAGVTPQQAFFVKCGLGFTMNDQDMMEGKINIEVGLAILRPSDFEVFVISHQLKMSKRFLESA